MSKKIIITEELKNILNQFNNPLNEMLLSGEVDDTNIIDPEKYINYLDLSHTNKGHLSYLTKDRITKIDESENKDYWEIKKRYHGRPSSVLKRLFNVNHSRYFEDFSMKFISIIDKPEFHMEVVKGYDIAKYYNYKNYYNSNGNLGSSCMNRMPDEIFEFYTKNENTINMLVMLDQYNKVMGRAILWNGEDFRIMDRIYTCNDLYESYFHDWAKENDVICKEQNNYRTPIHMIDSKNNEKFFKKCHINLNEVNFDKYPYLDTFKWLDKISKKIYNYIPSKDLKLFVLCDSMGGTLLSDSYDFDEITNEMYCKQDIIHLDYINKRVYVGHVVKSHVYNRYIHINHHKRDEEIRDYIFNDEYNHLNDYEKIKDKKIEIEEKIKNGLNKLTELKLSAWESQGYQY